jgi:uncharacterized membrane protein YoaK (UPF0700 family)
MKLSLPGVMSLNAGYVDTAGFLALKGLFTAHVTGNFVTLASALVFGTSGALSKVLTLPVFCVVVLLVRILPYRFRDDRRPALRGLIFVQVALLLAAALLAGWFSPFNDADAWPALVTGMTLVAAMAIQNAAHRIYLPSTPPSTVMTGTTTQIMIDVGDLLHGVTPESAAATRSGFRRLGAALSIFAVGCAAGAIAYATVREWCFLAAPLIGIVALCTAGKQNRAPAHAAW